MSYAQHHAAQRFFLAIAATTFPYLFLPPRPLTPRRRRLCKISTAQTRSLAALALHSAQKLHYIWRRTVLTWHLKVLGLNAHQRQVSYALHFCLVLTSRPHFAHCHVPTTLCCPLLCTKIQALHVVYAPTPFAFSPLTYFSPAGITLYFMV